MNVLVIDIGGSNVKILATGEKEPRKFPSGPTLTPWPMVDGVKKLATDWKYDAVSIGYPGPILRGRPVSEPNNLSIGGSRRRKRWRCLPFGSLSATFSAFLCSGRPEQWEAQNATHRPLGKKRSHAKSAGKKKAGSQSQ
jgi:hypothetical protein